MLLVSQRELLRQIVFSAGQLACQHLNGPERGSIVTLSMVLDALLLSEADSVVFLHVREKFEGLPTLSPDLTVLYAALVHVCDLAVHFDEEQATKTGTSLLGLSAPSSEFLN